MLTPSEHAGFRHEAVFYAGDDDFVTQLLPFVRDAVLADEPILVAVAEHKLERLRAELGRDAAAVELVALDRVGANPGRIISLWHDFVARHAPSGRPLRGIGEPIWAGRDADELEEAHRHEALLNVAFGAGAPFALWCPYDVSTLDEAVVAEARRTHPAVRGLGGARASDAYPAAYEADPFGGALAEPDAAATEVTFDDRSLRDVRGLVGTVARAAGLSRTRAEDLVVAVHELAANSIVHGGGSGVLRLWQADATVVCEVRDRGRIREPLTGRLRSPEERPGGRGVWLAHQLCDLVQVRSDDRGTVVRVHVRSG